MICYNMIDISEEIDVNKTSKSKECDVCDYLYFLDKVLSLNCMFAVAVMTY